MKTTRKAQDFKNGFSNGLSMWQQGCTFEQIKERAQETAFTKSFRTGLIAAAETLAGWLDEGVKLAKTCEVTPAELIQLTGVL